MSDDPAPVRYSIAPRPFNALSLNPYLPDARQVETPANALKESGAERETLDPIEARKVGDVVRRQREAPAPSERLRANEGTSFLLDSLHVFVRDSADVGRQGVEHATREWEGSQCPLTRRRHHDLRSGEKAGRNTGVHFVAADLPAAADDAAHRIVEPRTRAPDLDLLLARQPEAAVDQAVLEHDATRPRAPCR